MSYNPLCELLFFPSPLPKVLLTVKPLANPLVDGLWFCSIASLELDFWGATEAGISVSTHPLVSRLHTSFVVSSSVFLIF